MAITAAQQAQLDRFKEEQEEIRDNKNRVELEKWVANKVGSAVQKQYPRMRWAIEVDTAQQTVMIVCPILSTTKAYYLHLHRYTIHELTIRAVQVAGEILERHGVSRSQYLNTENVESMQRDLRNSVIASDAAPDPLRTCH